MNSLPRTLDLLEEGCRAGIHPGAQLFVSVGGRTVADLAIGEARPGVPMTTASLPLWLSSTKPVTAILVARLWERGALALDDPLVRFVPEFGAHGKEAITVRHALTHTGGFRMLDLGWPERGWDEVVRRVCAARPEPRWQPGRRAGYHMASSWFLLGEIVRRLEGRPFPDVVREQLFEPLGMTDCWVGIPPDRYASYGDRIVVTVDTEADPPRPHPWHEAAWVTSSSPAGGGRGPMSQLARLYAMLAAGGALGGARILRPQTVEAMLARQRGPMYDRTFRREMDWGLGFIPNSQQSGDADLPYHYGPHASPRAVGHSGYRSSTAFVDREHDLVVALAFSGTPSDEAHARRTHDVLAAVYEELGLATKPAERHAPRRSTSE